VGNRLQQLEVTTALAAALCAALAACEGRPHAPQAQPPSAAAAPARSDGAQERAARARMVQEQIAARGVRDGRVLEAMRAVPRHEFVLPSYRAEAYDDTPLPIEAGQTISQPYIVALMSELADVQAGDRVLEVGTGSGYQAAVLAQLGAEVYSIEIVEQLATSSRERLARLGYRATVRHGDGYAGWPEHAPFDAILVTAAPPRIPPPLEEQLEVGGKLVVPVGEGYQELLVVERTASGLTRRSALPVRFVPMTGKAQERP
jgi:protein-L-isoaspartate(D-aspartate) O-methyltransferase